MVVDCACVLGSQVSLYVSFLHPHKSVTVGSVQGCNGGPCSEAAKGAR